MGSKFVPVLIMVFVQLTYAGMTILSKVAMDSGMDPFVQVAYRQVSAAISLAPFAYFLERKTRPKLTLSILFHIFWCSVFGATMNQITYFVGLKNSSPTVACALSNLSPTVTFLLAIPLGLESVGLRDRKVQAKVLGTIVCVGGAILLSFYNGPVVFNGLSSVHWKLAESSRNTDAGNHGHFMMGPVFLIASSISWAVWANVQAKVGRMYPAPLSSSALMCFMASIQCVIIGFCFHHNLSGWALNPPIRAVSSLYAGIVCTALAFYLMSWCIEREGPLFVSIFSPGLLIVVAILSWAFLQEKVYVGTIVGSALIIAGVYGVLWGKEEDKIKDAESEMQLSTRV